MKQSTRKLTIRTIVLFLFIIVVLFIFSWLLTRGVNDDNREAVPTSENSKPEPSTVQKGTGGNTGAGTNTSNDPNIPTPSPAGGIDTNNIPAQ